MTCMSSFAAAEFDAVFDKGALDALMSTNSAEVRSQAMAMFQEICRVLAANGRYLCITLAEDYILQTLFSAFRPNAEDVVRSLIKSEAENSVASFCWDLSVSILTTKQRSPFVPYVVNLRKSAQRDVSITAEERVLVYFDNLGNSTTTSTTLSVTDATERLLEAQSFHQKQYNLGIFTLGRFETLHFWSKESAEIPRFTIFVLDAMEKGNRMVSRYCAVFMVPFGREADYQFTTQQGLEDIAQQAGCRRLIAVCCNRPHVFPEMSELQAELSSIAMSLRPFDMPEDEQIPYMAISAESDWETIADGKTPASGKYVVEESYNDDNDRAILRRLIFLQNQTFVQTEVRLLLKAGTSNSKSSSKKKKGGKGKKSKSKGKTNNTSETDRDDEYDFDYSYLDDHHKAILASLCLSNTICTGTSTDKSDASTPIRGVVIGLGGGALLMALNKYLPKSAELYVCDIDGEMATIAKEHFGFRENRNLQFLPCEGLALLNSISTSITNKTKSNSDTNNVQTEIVSSSLFKDPRLLDFLVIDADSKDTSLGMSAPPQPFTTPESLRLMHSLLQPGGLLIINTVARAKLKYKEFLVKVQTAFKISDLSSQNSSDGSENSVTSGEVYTVQPSEEAVNIEIVGVKGGADAPRISANSKPNKASKKSQAVDVQLDKKKQRSRNLEELLEV